MILLDIADLELDKYYCLLWKRPNKISTDLYFFSVNTLLKRNRYTVQCYYSVRCFNNSSGFASIIKYPRYIDISNIDTEQIWGITNNDGIVFELTDSEVTRHLLMERI